MPKWTHISAHKNDKLKHMITETRSLSEEALEQILAKARTHSVWLPEPVSDDLLEEIYNLMKWGPTSANSSPARIVFVKSPESKGKLLPCMAEGNVEKTKTAPVTAIIAQDMEFYEKLPKLFPFADARSWFAGNKSLSNRQHFATAACKALILSLPLVRLGWIAVRCRVLTMPKWMRSFFRARPGNRILSAISVSEIRANFAPEHHALNSMRPAKSSEITFRKAPSVSGLARSPCHVHWSRAVLT